MVHTVDINCDMGESFGAYTLGRDTEVLDFVSSANIACGYHAGDPLVMAATVDLAVAKGVAIGAHPGYRDLEGFGRRAMDITPEEAHHLVLYQIGALHGFVAARGSRIHHVKPHGALYNVAAKDVELAEAIASAVQQLDPNMILFGLSGSELIAAGERVGLRTASEAFADRSYQDDGSLTSRRLPGAMLEDESTAIEQVLRLVKEGRVRSQQGTDVDVRADTICIHGDEPRAVDFAKAIREALAREGIDVRPARASD
jgi:5-oxoprolinase (ATP-hydrolysing) subunit A